MRALLLLTLTSLAAAAPWPRAARAHRLRKREVLEGTDMVSTAEQFIERGATGSSMSGKPYLVRCAGKAPVERAQWLKAELQQLRAAPSPR